MDLKETQTKKPTTKVKPQVIDITYQDSTTRVKKGFVEVLMQLFKRAEDKEAKAWTIKANSLVAINGKARKLCQGYGRRFPKDVEVWEVIH